jgi:hypothetical protein
MQQFCLLYGSCQAPGMAQFEWIAQKLHRGVTYQTKVKDVVHAQEYSNEITYVVIHHYNECFLKCLVYLQSK